MSKKRVIAYVDGFNVYYGLRKQSKTKWLNIKSLISHFLEEDEELLGIKYFSATVSGSYDTGQPHRQQKYWEALRSLNNLEIIQGNFKIKERSIQITKDVKISGKVPEEKGTDVNLAVEVVKDCFMNKFDIAYVVSNDSDLLSALKITMDMNKKIKILNPGLNATDAFRQIGCTVSNIGRKYSDFQFSDPLIKSNGERIYKPKGW